MLCEKEITKKYRLDELENILLLLEDSIEKSINDNQIKDDCDEATCLIYTCGKCLVTIREIIVLCRNGFPDGALALSRNVYEQMIITSYIELIEDNDNRKMTLEKYNADYEIQRLRNHKFAHALNERIDDKKAVEEEIHKILARYDEKKMSDYWWTSGINSFFDMFMVVKNNTDNENLKPLLNNAHMLYKRACLVIHASAMGNRIRLGSNQFGVDMGPWDKGQEISLFLVAVSFIAITGYTAHYLDFSDKDASEINRTLNELALYYWRVAAENQIVE